MQIWWPDRDGNSQLKYKGDTVVQVYMDFEAWQIDVYLAPAIDGKPTNQLRDNLQERLSRMDDLLLPVLVQEEARVQRANDVGRKPKWAS